MDLQLQQKHVLITGGSKGIGLACARLFLQEGARVTLVSRSHDNLDRAAATLQQELPASAGRIACIAADLTQADAAVAALDQAERESGPLDILVNSAGAARRTEPDALRAEDWHAAMDAKYFTYVHMMAPAVKRMAQRGAGAVVNVIGAGGKVARPTHLPGGAANAALMLVTAGMAAAYGPQGVRVNAVNPGLTATERLKEGLAAEARMHGISEQEALQRASAQLPLRRIAEPGEIADAVAYLASARASYVSGAILSMDGALAPLI